MSGRKPMSSMRSASSKTTTRSSFHINAPRLIRSSTRPGVPTIIAAPALTCSICLRIGLPP